MPKCKQNMMESPAVPCIWHPYFWWLDKPLAGHFWPIWWIDRFTKTTLFFNWKKKLTAALQSVSWLAAWINNKQSINEKSEALSSILSCYWLSGEIMLACCLVFHPNPYHDPFSVTYLVLYLYMFASLPYLSNPLLSLPPSLPTLATIKCCSRSTHTVNSHTWKSVQMYIYTP